jgi:hypothetical protein
MTAQIPETLYYHGQRRSMCEEPLSDYFALRGRRPAFSSSSTALWRRYVGVWEIREDRLYLVGIDAKLEGGVKASLEAIFPGFPERVFAHWYSGELRLPQGRQLKYVHMGYGSVFESDLFLRIEKGVLVGRRTRINGKARPEAADDRPGGGDDDDFTIIEWPGEPLAPRKAGPAA